MPSVAVVWAFAPIRNSLRTPSPAKRATTREARRTARDSRRVNRGGRRVIAQNRVKAARTGGAASERLSLERRARGDVPRNGQPLGGLDEQEEDHADHGEADETG